MNKALLIIGLLLYHFSAIAANSTTAAKVETVIGNFRINYSIENSEEV